MKYSNKTMSFEISSKFLIAVCCFQMAMLKEKVDILKSYGTPNTLPLNKFTISGN